MATKAYTCGDCGLVSQSMNEFLKRTTLKTCGMAAHVNVSFSATPVSPPAEYLCRNSKKRFSSIVSQETLAGLSWTSQKAAIDSAAVKHPEALAVSVVFWKQSAGPTFETKDPPPARVSPRAVELSYTISEQARERPGRRSTGIEDRHPRVDLIGRVPCCQDCAAPGKNTGFHQPKQHPEGRPASESTLQGGTYDGDRDAEHDRRKPDLWTEALEADVRRNSTEGVGDEENREGCVPLLWRHVQVFFSAEESGVACMALFSMGIDLDETL